MYRYCLRAWYSTPRRYTSNQRLTRQLLAGHGDRGTLLASAGALGAVDGAGKVALVRARGSRTGEGRRASLAYTLAKISGNGRDPTLDGLTGGRYRPTESGKEFSL